MDRRLESRGVGAPAVVSGSARARSDFNVSAILHGRVQINNRTETTAIILAVRRAMAWPTDLRRLVIFTDSQICADGVNKWMDLWEADGWTRLGRRLENADL